MISWRIPIFALVAAALVFLFNDWHQTTGVMWVAASCGMSVRSPGTHVVRSEASRQQLVSTNPACRQTVMRHVARRGPWVLTLVEAA